MVNNPIYRLLVSGACLTRLTTEGRTKITNGPVYDLAESQQLLKAHGLRVVNEDAQDDQVEFDPELTDEELSDFILALVKDDYVDSERCKTSLGQTLDCDGYAMKWNRNRHRRWEHGAKLYVKIGFSQYQQNPRCLVVSIHPAKR